MKAAYDPRAMAMIRERGIVLEICPTSNLNTRVVSGWEEFRWIFDTFRRNDVRFTINTDGPEMLKTYIRDEMAQLGRLGILSVADQEQAAATSLAASFVPNVSDVPGTAPRARPTRRRRARGGLAPRTRSVDCAFLDAVRAAAVARGDVRLARDIGAEHVAEQLQLGLAGRRRAARDVVDGAVVLLEADGPVGVDHGLGQVALGGLDLGELVHAGDRGASPGDSIASWSRTRSPSCRRRAAKTSSSSSSPPTAPIAARRPAASAS